MAVLKNVKCRWASIQEPNRSPDYGDKWEIEAELNDQQAAEFADAGVRLKTDDDGIKLLRFTRKTGGTKRDGSRYENTAPKCVDASKNPFTDLIGNGSEVNIAYNLREWTMMGNSGVKADLTAVQVLTLVPYRKAGGGVSEFEDEGETAVATSSEVEEIDDIF